MTWTKGLGRNFELNNASNDQKIVCYKPSVKTLQDAHPPDTPPAKTAGLTTTKQDAPTHSGTSVRTRMAAGKTKTNAGRTASKAKIGSSESPVSRATRNRFSSKAGRFNDKPSKFKLPFQTCKPRCIPRYL